MRAEFLNSDFGIGAVTGLGLDVLHWRSDRIVLPGFDVAEFTAYNWQLGKLIPIQGEVLP